MMTPVKPASALAAHGLHLPPIHLPAVKGPSFSGVLASKIPVVVGGKTNLPNHAIVLPRSHQGEPDLGKKRQGHDGDLDPATRQAAQLGPAIPPAIAAPERAEVAVQTNARISLEDLLPALVKKVAWSGDAQRGTVHMQLGAGELAGASLTVSSENGRVRVKLDAPPGTDTASWRDRLRARLEARGLSIESLEVD